MNASTLGFMVEGNRRFLALLLQAVSHSFERHRMGAFDEMVAELNEATNGDFFEALLAAWAILLDQPRHGTAALRVLTAEQAGVIRVMEGNGVAHDRPSGFVFDLSETLLDSLLAVLNLNPGTRAILEAYKELAKIAKAVVS